MTPVRLEPAPPGLESSTLPLCSLSDARVGIGAPGNQGDKKIFFQHGHVAYQIEGDNE